MCTSDKLSTIEPSCSNRKKGLEDSQLLENLKVLIYGEDIGRVALACFKIRFTHLKMRIAKECTDTVYRVESGVATTIQSDFTLLNQESILFES